MEKPQIILQGLAFPEAPRWHDGQLWFVDLRAQKVMTLDAGGRTHTVVEVPNDPSGLGWTPDGRLLVVSMKDRRLLRRDKDGLKCVADLHNLAAGDCNDMVVDAVGRAYIGNYGLITGHGKNLHFEPAEIIVVEPDGRASIAAKGLHFPNGMVITPDGRTLIVAESFASRLTSFDIAPDGALANKQIWAELEKGYSPDGICLDAEGAVWAANATGPVFVRVKRGGEITHRIETSAYAYACMLGGPDRRTLYIMVAEASNDPSVYRKKMTGRIETLRVEVPGAGRP
jgi:sugar lactone lactonase YvrE